MSARRHSMGHAVAHHEAAEARANLSSLLPSAAAIAAAAAAFRGGDDEESARPRHQDRVAPTVSDDTGSVELQRNQLHECQGARGDSDAVQTDAYPGQESERPAQSNADAVVVNENRDGAAADDDDDSEPNFPASFESWDALESYIREFAAQSYQVFRIRSTVSTRARNANLAKQLAPSKRASSGPTASGGLLPDSWEFYSKTYTCTHGLTYQPSEKRLQKSAPLTVRASGCTARINASVTFNKATHSHAIRAAVRGWHNHPVGREQYYSYVENRRITDPALLAMIAHLDTQGEKAKAIFEVVSKHVVETTGKECVFQLRDIRNVVFRIQTEKRKTSSSASKKQKKRGRVSVDNLVSDAPSYEEDDEEEEDVEEEGDSFEDEYPAIPSSLAASAPATSNTLQHSCSTTNPSNKRRVRAYRMGIPPALTESLERPQSAQSVVLKLSRLEMMMDSAFCYALSHGYNGHMPVVAVEAIPKRITRFKHEVVRIPPGFRVQDVDFVLPKYAVDGCERRIIDTCRLHQLLPPAVGVSLSVQKRDSQETFAVTLTSRQVKTMKRYYFAREVMSQVRKTIDWLSSITFQARPSYAPFEDCSVHPTEFLTYPLSTMSLSKTNVSGSSMSSRGGVIRFSDSIHGPSILKFGGPTIANIDVDCVKAVLLHMHARFHVNGNFVGPGFVYESNPNERRRQATLYGAFLAPKQFIAGVVQFQDDQWGGFFYDTETKTCRVYACGNGDNGEAGHRALQTIVTDLWRDFDVQVTDFKMFQACPFATAGAVVDSGVLALLFVELMLYGKAWADVPVESVDYLRCRFMQQAIQVLNKQDVHLIQWFANFFVVQKREMVGANASARLIEQLQQPLRSSVPLSPLPPPAAAVTDASTTAAAAPLETQPPTPPVATSSAAVPLADAVVDLVSDDGDASDNDNDIADDPTVAATGPITLGRQVRTMPNSDATPFLLSRGLLLNPHEHFPSRFYSWDEFHKHVRAFCIATFQVFRSRTSTSVALANKEQKENPRLGVFLRLSKKPFEEEHDEPMRLALAVLLLLAQGHRHDLTDKRCEGLLARLLEDAREQVHHGSRLPQLEARGGAEGFAARASDVWRQAGDLVDPAPEFDEI